jgi:hypothetical protein
MKHKMAAIFIMSNKFVGGFKLLESNVLNNTIIIARLKGEVKYVMH